MKEETMMEKVELYFCSPVDISFGVKEAGGEERYNLRKGGDGLWTLTGGADGKC